MHEYIISTSYFNDRGLLVVVLVRRGATPGHVLVACV